MAEEAALVLSRILAFSDLSGMTGCDGGWSAAASRVLTVSADDDGLELLSGTAGGCIDAGWGVCSLGEAEGSLLTVMAPDKKALFRSLRSVGYREDLLVLKRKICQHSILMLLMICHSCRLACDLVE